MNCPRSSFCADLVASKIFIQEVFSACCKLDQVLFVGYLGAFGEIIFRLKINEGCCCLSGKPTMNLRFGEPTCSDRLYLTRGGSPVKAVLCISFVIWFIFSILSICMLANNDEYLLIRIKLSDIDVISQLSSGWLMKKCNLF